MEISYSKQAAKALRKMPANTADLIRGKIDQLATSPQKLANNIKKLAGSDDTYRLRIGDWRVIYTENGDILFILGINPRGSAYD